MVCSSKWIPERLKAFLQAWRSSPECSDPIPQPPLIGSLDDFLVFHDIRCTDADGNVFENYPTLHVRKDVLRDVNGGQGCNGSYHDTLRLSNAIVYCEKNDFFLPSFALTCNVVAALYRAAVRKKANGTYTTLDDDLKKILDDYKNNKIGSPNTGWHAQNTAINYGTGEIIHYPNAKDFRQDLIINSSRLRTSLNFSKETLYCQRLAVALNDPAHTHYVRQLTGLADPSILVELGQYFGKPTELAFPWDGQAGIYHNETSIGVFGSSGISLELLGGNDLGSPSAIRIVQAIQPTP